MRLTLAATLNEQNIISTKAELRAEITESWDWLLSIKEAMCRAAVLAQQ